ncbi:MAG: hypothetical protein GY756_08050 [bacterium]|nr:hypothetical protein [bacterium]
MAPNTNQYDYHIHYYLDRCSNNEMTINNIEKEAVRLGLDEICIVKHYSKQLPNNKSTWVHWKKVFPEQFEYYLKDISSQKTYSSIRLLSGVETEIINDRGQINIPENDAKKLDMLLLSVHWLPDMNLLKLDPELIPGNFKSSPTDIVKNWQRKVDTVGIKPIIENFVSAYVNAIINNNYPMILAHMHDGLQPLRQYKIQVDNLSDNELNYLMEPLMKICAEKHVLWELTEEEVKRPSILKRANDLKVKFTATVDAHCLHADGYTNLIDHYKAENYLNSLGLNKSKIEL